MGNEKEQSPLPTEIKLRQVRPMNFPDAMRCIIGGKKIHKLEWKHRNYYGFLNGDILSLHKPDGKNYQWIVSNGDLMGEDYIEVN